MCSKIYSTPCYSAFKHLAAFKIATIVSFLCSFKNFLGKTFKRQCLIQRLEGCAHRSACSEMWQLQHIFLLMNKISANNLKILQSYARESKKNTTSWKRMEAIKFIKFTSNLSPYPPSYLQQVTVVVYLDE